jgi:hypothetical protein
MVLADGSSQGQINDRRGKLFEQFIARFLTRYGYENPTRRNLNVTEDGIELDVALRALSDNHLAIVECKAYSTNVSPVELSNFIGKLVEVRWDEGEDVFGWFFALPAFTRGGDKRARKAEQRDKRFRVFTSVELVEDLRRFGLIADTPPGLGLSSDQAVVVTEHGVYSAVKELDPAGRLPSRVWVWGTSNVVPDPVRDFLASSPYAAGVQVVPAGTSPTMAMTRKTREPLVIDVPASTGDWSGPGFSDT